MTENKPLGGDSNKFNGEYIGKVVDVADPKKLLRARVRVFSVFSDDVPAADLPWAEYRLPVGSRFNDGFFIPADVGDFVWVKFPYDGDTRRPVIIGSAHYAPDGKPNFPHEAWQGTSQHAHKRIGKEPAPADHGYHKDVVFTQHGASIEMREDTSISIIQRGTGTEINIDPQGVLTIHSENALYLSATENCEAVIQKKTVWLSMEGIDHDGGTGDLSGVVTKDCLCAFTGKPHADFSLEVRASKG